MNIIKYANWFLRLAQDFDSSRDTQQARQALGLTSDKYDSKELLEGVMADGRLVRLLPPTGAGYSYE